jgi:Uma2 family endonuclease
MSSDVNVPATPGSEFFPLPPECIPDVESLVIEDGVPVETIFAEKQYRLLTEPLYTSWPGPGEGRPFVVLANVGLFFAMDQPPLAPDVMLSLDVQVKDLTRKENRSYFTWVFGKPPDVVIEFVSDRRGGEDAYKLNRYAQVGIPYYAIFDPGNRLGKGILRTFSRPGKTYKPLTSNWFDEAQIGLTLWEGTYEGYTAQWLRWCDEQGQVIPTGSERLEHERLRREQLEARLRELGLEP